MTLKKNYNESLEILKEENLKMTPQRIEVFREVCDSNEHRESEEIFLSLRKRDVNISRATVYRTMDILYQYDLVQRMDIGDGKWRYEHWLDCHQHDHLICIRCGTIVEFINTQIEEIQNDVAEKFDYEEQKILGLNTPYVNFVINNGNE